MIRHTLLNRLSINRVLEMIAFRSVSLHSDLYPHIHTYILTIKTFILIFRTCKSTFRPVSSHSDLSPYIQTVTSYLDLYPNNSDLYPHILTSLLKFKHVALYSDCLLIFKPSPDIQTVSSHSDMFSYILTYILTIKTFKLIFRTSRSTF